MKYQQNFVILNFGKKMPKKERLWASNNILYGQGLKAELLCIAATNSLKYVPVLLPFLFFSLFSLSSNEIQALLPNLSQYLLPKIR